MEYRCKFCKKPDIHYFLFCPQNPDPNSVYRKHRAKVQSKGPFSPDRREKRSPSPSLEVPNDHKTRKLSFLSTTVHNSSRECASPEPKLGDSMKFSSPRQH